MLSLQQTLQQLQCNRGLQGKLGIELSYITIGTKLLWVITAISWYLRPGTPWNPEEEKCPLLKPLLSNRSENVTADTNLCVCVCVRARACNSGL
jgi:hypothetical protein